MYALVTHNSYNDVDIASHVFIGLLFFYFVAVFYLAIVVSDGSYNDCNKNTINIEFNISLNDRNREEVLISSSQYI